MRKLLPILILPLAASCSTLQTADSKAVTEVITADLARADGSWAGVVTISKRSDGIFLSLAADAPSAGSSGCTFMQLANAKVPISPARVDTGILK
jgi:superoxide dismutase, Cu-Zn family